jgi:hypothetical protein
MSPLTRAKLLDQTFETTITATSFMVDMAEHLIGEPGEPEAMVMTLAGRIAGALLAMVASEARDPDVMIEEALPALKEKIGEAAKRYLPTLLDDVRERRRRRDCEAGRGNHRARRAS